MTGTDVLHVLLGGVLVVIGILASALADRVRGLRVARERQVAAVPSAPTPRTRDRTRDAEIIQRSRQLFGSESPEEQVVITALITAGYKKTAATDAARSCEPAERMTIEGWTASALRRAGKGAPS